MTAYPASMTVFPIALLGMWRAGLAKALKTSLFQRETKLPLKAVSLSRFFLFAEVRGDLLPTSSFACHESAVG